MYNELFWLIKKKMYNKIFYIYREEKMYNKLVYIDWEEKMYNKLLNIVWVFFFSLPVTDSARLSYYKITNNFFLWFIPVEILVLKVSYSFFNGKWVNHM